MDAISMLRSARRAGPADSVGKVRGHPPSACLDTLFFRPERVVAVAWFYMLPVSSQSGRALICVHTLFPAAALSASLLSMPTTLGSGRGICALCL